MKPTKLGTLELSVMGVSFTVKGAVYHPNVPATQIDPPEHEFAEWGAVFVGDKDVSELFEYRHNAQRLEEAILVSVEDQ